MIGSLTAGRGAEVEQPGHQRTFPVENGRGPGKNQPRADPGQPADTDSVIAPPGIAVAFGF
jgi:hypothetical protein